MKTEQLVGNADRQPSSGGNPLLVTKVLCGVCFVVVVENPPNRLEVVWRRLRRRDSVLEWRLIPVLQSSISVFPFGAVVPQFCEASEHIPS